MKRDFMNREYELIVLDVELRRILTTIHSEMRMIECFKGTADKQTSLAYRIMVEAYKRAARYLISMAEDIGLIDYDDWSVMNMAITNIGLDPEDRI